MQELNRWFRDGRVFMSMSFAGNQKLSALSICARAIRMSVLALCGNSGVILLSVKRQNTLILQFRDVTLFRHLIKRVPGLASGIAYGDNGRVSVFLLLQLSYTQIMVGWVGHRKVRRFPYAPVTPTLLSSPPAKLAFPVVEVIHCIRRLPSWLRSLP